MRSGKSYGLRSRFQPGGGISPSWIIIAGTSIRPHVLDQPAAFEQHEVEAEIAHLRQDGRDGGLMRLCPFASTIAPITGQARGGVMDGYATVTCSSCNQSAYLERLRLEAPQWYCPSCGARNETPAKEPAMAGASAARTTSPFVPPAPTTPPAPAAPSTAPVSSSPPPPVPLFKADSSSDASPPSVGKRTMGKSKRIVIGVFAILGLVAVASQFAGDKDASPTSPDRGSTSALSDAPAIAPAPPAPEPVAYVPKPSDFSLAVKILEKDCFGSAGCLITYRIDVSYGGPALDPATEYEVIYEVSGDEDGPITNTFTVQGDSASVDKEEDASTKNSKVKLTAKVIEVVS